MIEAGRNVEDAVRAARRLAAAHGVLAREPVVLSDGANVLVHLAPAPVVARVAALTGIVRPDIVDTFAKDVALAGYLASRGAPVVPPSDELPPGPHRREGRTVSFWRYVEHDPGHTFRPEVVGGALGALHAELRGYPGELPPAPPLNVAEIVAYLAGSAWGDLTDLVAATDGVLAALDGATAGREPVPLHGDAHPGNLLSTPNGPMWTDFEDAWRGPAGWDLSCLRGTTRLDGAAAVAAYPGPPPDREVFDAVTRARALQSTVWELMYAEWQPDRRSDAARALRAWRAGVDTRVAGG